MQWKDVAIVFEKVFDGYLISCFYFFPTIFMAVVYYKISRTVIKQNKHMKSIYSNPVRRNAPSSSFNILKFIRNRQIFLVYLITMILCYGIGNIPMTVYLILTIAEKHNLLMKYVWILYLANVLRVASAFSKSSYIWNIGQKVAHILETLQQEEAQINSSCSKLNKQDIFLDYLIGRLLLFQDEACISFKKNRTK
jgi:hypothetical protein